MKKIILGASFLFLFFVHIFSQNGETWDINSLTSIGGHSVTVYGTPTVVSTDLGDAVEFKGKPAKDQLIVNANPLSSVTEFTVEVIFKPYYTTEEPRMIHIQDPQKQRAMIEIRINDDENWHLDGYLQTDLDGLTLINPALTHPLEEWAHAAITYKNDTFKTYVNGVEELSGTLGYTSSVIGSNGQTSIGARMTYENYFTGIIRKLKISYEALPPDEFITDEITSLHSSNIY